MFSAAIRQKNTCLPYPTVDRLDTADRLIQLDFMNDFALSNKGYQTLIQR